MHMQRATNLGVQTLVYNPPIRRTQHVHMPVQNPRSQAIRSNNQELSMNPTCTLLSAQDPNTENLARALMRCSAQVMKSVKVLRLLSSMPSWCQYSPRSPPPRTWAMAYTNPLRSTSAPPRCQRPIAREDAPEKVHTVMLQGCGRDSATG